MRPGRILGFVNLPFASGVESPLRTGLRYSMDVDIRVWVRDTRLAPRVPLLVPNITNKQTITLNKQRRDDIL